MPKTLKKKTIIRKITQATIVSVYLFVIFSAPSNHTCNLCEKTSKHHCDNKRHCCYTKTHKNTQPEMSSKQGAPEAETVHHSNICTACQYSITSKFTQVGTAKTLISASTPNHLRASFTFKAIKQSEWGSSVFLRAPPVTIS
jgi:hypothetical protein